MPEVDLITEYLDYLENTKKTASNTLAAYRRDLNSYKDFLDAKKLTVSQATSSTVSKYKDCLAKNGKSVATVSRCMSCLRSFYKYLVVTEKVNENPARTVKNDKTEKKFFEILSEDEIDSLLSQPDTTDFKGKRDKAMLEILYATGVKVSELMALDVSDVNLKMQLIKCHGESSKSSERVIMLYPSAVRELDDYLRNARNYFVSDPDESALFVNVNGERMTRQGFWKLLKNYADSAGISKSITPHTLRHSFATHLLENGADIHDIKDILGHADISSTQVYSDFIKSRVNNSYLKYNHRAR